MDFVVNFKCQVQCTMKHVHFQFPKMNQIEFNQPLKLNTIVKYALIHGLLLITIVFNQRLYCCDYDLSHKPDAYINSRTKPKVL